MFIPGMAVDDEGVVADPILTSTDGVALVKYPASRTSDVGVSVSKPGFLGRSGNWQSGSIPDEITYRSRRVARRFGAWCWMNRANPVAGAQVRLNSHVLW